MKPCCKNRPLLAMVALRHAGELPDAGLQKHLETCKECRDYLEEFAQLSTVIQAAAAEPRADFVPAERFYRQLSSRILESKPRSFLDGLLAFLSGYAWNWRVAIPATVSFVGVILSLVFLRGKPEAPAQPPAAAAIVSQMETELAPPTSLSHYQAIASRSLEELDRLLIEQSTRSLPPAPIFTAATFGLKLQD